ncbi:amidohydrolase 2 [Rhodopirellula maiorica SM1]|uniref:Amidohydrolase 2 n=1 Tax=Rhodopirellula maiorica SM1 TaxID=1265738 RepID=M5R8N2_9BACT|nr:glucuronate isomerase [Rhodopirellula maiorica]EMI15406.1 amidohydrolase 2 [Rhodopirellula maiorica SM1]
MSHPARDSIYQAIASIRLIDPHTHINPHSPASRTLADLLGYHYYTELAHSSGMPKHEIEEPGISPHELVGRLVHNLGPIENTSQYRWLVEICKKFFGFESDRIDTSNWESVYDTAERSMASAQWSQTVLDQSNVEAVFLTNDFDDALSGFDTNTYIPCLRTDDLVFKLHEREVRERLERCSGVTLTSSLGSLRSAIRQRFEHFTENGARACAISLPPWFEPTMVNEGRATNALGAVLRHGESVDAAHLAALSRAVFWMLAELCDEFKLPFDLMIGVNRGVYAEGVFQGQDLYDSRVSLIQYRELFNTFPEVKFPVSVLASVTNQELVSYAWIFPNVITNGHWWYSNTPSFIHRDAAGRLEAVPQTKQIGYYSDAYKLEFVWPKFDMYRNILANILAEHFVGFNGWSEEQAIELGYKVLRGNVEEIFPSRASETAVAEETSASTPQPSDDLGAIGVAGAAAAASSAALTGEAIGFVEVDSDPIALDDEADSPQTDLDASATGDADALETIPMDDMQEVVDELDPLPSEDELGAVEIADVELVDHSTERQAVDAEVIQSEADPEPLDVGDLFGDDDAGIGEEAADGATAQSGDPYATVSDESLLGDTDVSIDSPSESTEINPLRGEESFSLDEDSLRVQPDPLTGELTFPTADGPANEDSQTDRTASDDETLDQLGIGFVEEDNEEQVRFEATSEIEDPEEPKR